MQIISKKPIAVALSAALVLGTTIAPITAKADSVELQKQLDAAQAKLDTIYSQAEQVSEQLNETKYQLEQTNAEIEQTEADIETKKAELAEAKGVLSQHVADSYKSGPTSLLSIIFNSTSFDEFTSNIYYATKISASDAEAVNTVKTIQQELDEKRTSLETAKEEQTQLLADQTAQQASLEQQSAEAEAYVNSLSNELQEALAAEEAARQAEAARKAEEALRKAEEEAAKQQSNTPSNNSNSNSSNNNSSSNTNSNSSNSSSNNNSSNNTPAPAPTPTPSNQSSNLGGGTRSTIVAAARSMIGGSYVWGGYNPSARQFDCSGLTSYAYAVAGISIPHSSASQAAFCNKPASQAEVGDVVWRPGHVGIYAGGGVTIEAFSPGQGIGYGSLSSFSRAGSPI